MKKVISIITQMKGTTKQRIKMLPPLILGELNVKYHGL